MTRPRYSRSEFKPYSRKNVKYCIAYGYEGLSACALCFLVFGRLIPRWLPCSLSRYNCSVRTTPKLLLYHELTANAIFNTGQLCKRVYIFATVLDTTTTAAASCGINVALLRLQNLHQSTRHAIRVGAFVGPTTQTYHRLFDLLADRTKKGVDRVQELYDR
jgi:hypothetical protein